MKTRKIFLKKERIHKLVEAFTYKLAKVSVEGTAERKDSVQADVEENIDGTIIDTLADSREARLRQSLSFCLKPREDFIADNINDMEGVYVFILELNDDFNDNQLDAIASKMNDYIYKGVLYDWYSDMGLTYGDKLLPEINALESEIPSAFRVGSYARPEVPHYGAYKIR